MRSGLVRPGFVALLIVVVLFSQWMGMRHRIEHAGWSNSFPAAAQTATTDAQSDTGQPDGRKPHSCALFDGVALADTIAIVPFALPLQTSARVLALWLAFTSWDAPLTRFFLSRAPPQAQ